PNSRLRWERTNVFNLGVDFGLWQGRLKGVLEYYSKNIKDILAEAPVDPTFGISSFYGNVASMEGEGFEIELSSFIPLSTSWRWDGSLLFSYAQTRVTDYLLPTPGTADFLNAGSIITPIVEKPLYSIYSYRWAGLDSETGDPQGYLNDEISKDYGEISNTPPQQLVFHGPVQPPYFGAFRNTFSWKALSVSIGVNYHFGHFFRRRSINYTSLFRNWTGHSDYANRWRKPGDEAHTDVPSLVFPAAGKTREGTSV